MGDGDLLPSFEDIVIPKMAIVGPVYEDMGVFINTPVAICFIPWENDTEHRIQSEDRFHRIENKKVVRE